MSVVTSGKSINKATKRVLDVLSQFTGASTPLGVSEISRSLGMTRNMVFRALVTLADEGLLARDDTTGRYYPGCALADLQNANTPPPDFRSMARPCIEAISEVTGETVQLCVRSGDFQTILDGVEGKGRVVLRVKLGRVIHLHASVGSRAILAACTDKEIEGFLKRNSPLPRYTRTTLTTPQQIWAEVAAIRERGYAISFGDFNSSTAGMAFAITDIDGRPYGSVAIGGPIDRLGDRWFANKFDDVARHIADLQRVASSYECS